MANDLIKKPEIAKPSKVETINLKVLIHCEGCRKKVRKTLLSIEGVYTVEVDGLGKVTVTGTADSKVLIQKLYKAGKMAEVISPPAKAKFSQTRQNQGKEEEDESSKKEGKNGSAADAEAEGADEKPPSNGEVGKKKKGGENTKTAGDVPKNTHIHKNMQAGSMIETGYASMESTEYASHLFSDENANNCNIM